MPNGNSTGPINILFATNRKQSPQNGSWGGPDFEDVVASLPGTPQDISCSVATVTGVAIDNADGGTIQSVGPLNAGWFTPAQLAPFMASTNDILVFVHGTDNSFSDAIKRAAYNRTWLAAAGLAAQAGAKSTFDVITFTWPSQSYGDSNFLGEANLFGDYDDYREDQQQARNSAFHFGYFLQQIATLRGRIAPQRRINLLCHSMGNYMMAGAVELMFKQGTQAPARPVFDEVVLAAADEEATTFAQPNGGRLSNLWRLGHEITTYFNNNDILMGFSEIVNAEDGKRLGDDGPPNEADTHFFSPNIYEFVDCTGINDSIGTGLLDSHQYYRKSPTVRADIVATLLGLTPKRLGFDPKANRYWLFPQ